MTSMQPCNQPPSPPPIYDWPTMVQRYYCTEQQLQLVMSQLRAMQQQLDDLKGRPPLHVEYHFDQLKVNRLEGTLNVGITPQGMPAIESLETPEAPGWKVESPPDDDSEDPVRAMQAEIGAYMDREGTQTLIALEHQYAYPLDDAHRTRIVDDVRKQLNERVRYYVTMKPPPKEGTEDDQLKWSAEIAEKTKRDIKGAYSAYLQKLAPSDRGKTE